MQLVVWMGIVYVRRLLQVQFLIDSDPKGEKSPTLSDKQCILKLSIF